MLQQQEHEQQQQEQQQIRDYRMKSTEARTDGKQKQVPRQYSNSYNKDKRRQQVSQWIGLEYRWLRIDLVTDGINASWIYFGHSELKLFLAMDGISNSNSI